MSRSCACAPKTCIQELSGWRLPLLPLPEYCWISKQRVEFGKTYYMVHWFCLGEETYGEWLPEAKVHPSLTWWFQRIHRYMRAGYEAGPALILEDIVKRELIIPNDSHNDSQSETR